MSVLLPIRTHTSLHTLTALHHRRQTAAHDPTGQPCPSVYPQRRQSACSSATPQLPVLVADAVVEPQSSSGHLARHHSRAQHSPRCQSARAASAHQQGTAVLLRRPIPDLRVGHHSEPPNVCGDAALAGSAMRHGRWVCHARRRVCSTTACNTPGNACSAVAPSLRRHRPMLSLIHI